MIKMLIKNKIKIIIVIIIGVVLYIFYALQNPGNQLLTDVEIQNFIEARGISPLCINNVGKSYTAIVFEDELESEMNVYFVYKNKYNVIKDERYSFYVPGRLEEKDVEIWGTGPAAYNMIGYVGIIIFDEEIAIKANEAKVLLDNGIVESADFNGNNILLLPATRKYFWQKTVFKTVEIYDKDGEVLQGFYTSLDEKYRLKR